VKKGGQGPRVEKLRGLSEGERASKESGKRIWLTETVMHLAPKNTTEEKRRSALKDSKGISTRDGVDRDEAPLGKTRKGSPRSKQEESPFRNGLSNRRTPSIENFPEDRKDTRRIRETESDIPRCVRSGKSEKGKTEGRRHEKERRRDVRRTTAKTGEVNRACKNGSQRPCVEHKRLSARIAGR